MCNLTAAQRPTSPGNGYEHYSITITPDRHVTVAANRNLVAATDALTHTTRYGYDADDERTTITQTDGTVLRTGYDAAGNVISRTNGLTQTTRYGYDAVDPTGLDCRLWDAVTLKCRLPTWQETGAILYHAAERQTTSLIACSKWLKPPHGGTKGRERSTGCVGSRYRSQVQTVCKKVS
jgi:YD repeat-containing protein